MMARSVFGEIGAVIMSPTATMPAMKSTAMLKSALATKLNSTAATATALTWLFCVTAKKTVATDLTSFPNSATINTPPMGFQKCSVAQISNADCNVFPLRCGATVLQSAPTIPMRRTARSAPRTPSGAAPAVSVYRGLIFVTEKQTATMPVTRETAGNPRTLNLMLVAKSMSSVASLAIACPSSELVMASMIVSMAATRPSSATLLAPLVTPVDQIKAVCLPQRVLHVSANKDFLWQPLASVRMLTSVPVSHPVLSFVQTPKDPLSVAVKKAMRWKIAAADLLA